MIDYLNGVFSDNLISTDAVQLVYDTHTFVKSKHKKFSQTGQSPNSKLVIRYAMLADYFSDRLTIGWSFRIVFRPLETSVILCALCCVRRSVAASLLSLCDSLTSCIEGWVVNPVPMLGNLRGQVCHIMTYISDTDICAFLMRGLRKKKALRDAESLLVFPMFGNTRVRCSVRQEPLFLVRRAGRCPWRLRR